MVGIGRRCSPGRRAARGDGGRAGSVGAGRPRSRRERSHQRSHWEGVHREGCRREGPRGAGGDDAGPGCARGGRRGCWIRGPGCPSGPRRRIRPVPGSPRSLRLPLGHRCPGGLRIGSLGGAQARTGLQAPGSGRCRSGGWRGDAVEVALSVWEAPRDRSLPRVSGRVPQVRPHPAGPWGATVGRMSPGCAVLRWSCACACACAAGCPPVPWEDACAGEIGSPVAWLPAAGMILGGRRRGCRGRQDQLRGAPAGRFLRLRPPAGSCDTAPNLPGWADAAVP